MNIVGFGAEMDQITVDTLEPYLRLTAAAEQDNIQVSINSATLSDWSLILTRLQPGVRQSETARNRFNGFPTWRV